MKHLYLLSILFILAAVLDADGQSFSVGDDNAGMRSSTEKITRYTEIKGVVIDSLTSEPLRDVLVSILSPEMAVRHSGTDGKGRFRFTDVKAEGLKIEITCLGYKIYAAYPESSGRILDMGKIRLGPDPQHIDQITVRARMSFFTIRGDTATRRPGAPQTGRELRTPPGSRLSTPPCPPSPATGGRPTAPRPAASPPRESSFGRAPAESGRR